MSILVSGIAGFIGSNFARRFMRARPRVPVIGIDDLSTGRREAVPEGATLYRGSITDCELIARVFANHNPSYVFHFAALPRVAYSVAHPVETAEVNVMGTLALLEASAKHAVQRFIFSSSSSVYGNARSLPTRETEPPDPRSPYALQKYMGEQLCRQWSELYGLDTVSLRYFNVYGPWQRGDSPYSTVIAAWLEALYHSRVSASDPRTSAMAKPYLEGDGKQTRDFCFVDDVAEANLLAMRAQRACRGDVVNVAAGKRTGLLELKALIERAAGRTLDLEHRGPRVGDVRDTEADTRKARRLLGFKAPTSLEAGLLKTIRWFQGEASKMKR